MAPAIRPISPMFDDSRNIRYFLMLPNMPRPSSTAATIDAKLSSRSVIAAASLATSVPVMPMATPMSARLSAGRVVHAVAGHGYDVPAALQGRNDAELVGGRHACVDVDGLDAGIERSVVHEIELGARDRRGRDPRGRARGDGAPVAGWSPVIITTRMPAHRQVSIAAAPRRAAGRSSRPGRAA